MTTIHRLNPNKFLYLRSAFRQIDAAYKDDCCHHFPEAIDLSGYEKLIEALANKLQSGELKPSDLDRGLIDKIYNDVSEPVKKEYGKKFIDYDYKEPGSLIQKFKKNLWQFSCAKTLTQLEYVNSLLLDKNGRVKPEHTFKADLKKANILFNHNYLNAEYQTAKRGAQMAHMWSKFVDQADIYPNLVYRTVGDERVRPEHEALNGIVKHINDPFWQEYYPPNGWRCRCTVMNTSAEPTKGKYEDKSIIPEFKGNTALDEEIFSSKGNFFKLLNKDHKAKVNTEYMKYNMPYEVAYKSKNKKQVFVSPYADSQDLVKNVETGMVIVDQLNKNVWIRANINVQGHANAEYIIDGVLADRKEQIGKNVSSNVQSAHRQGCKIIVFDISPKYPYSLERFKQNLKGVLKHYNSFEKIIIVKGNTVEEIAVKDFK